MSKQNQDTMLMVGALAGTVGFVAFVALMILGNYAVSPAVFLAALVAIVAGLVLMIGFHRKTDAPVRKLDRAPSVASSAPPRPVAAAVVTTEPVSATAEPSVSADAALATRPSALAAPRDGAADDLKQIKGIGPKLEELCHSLGFYHFDQIAGWSDAEVDWVDENLEGFKGRVSRDAWVEQARLLAAGGETEFSKKVRGSELH